MEKDENTKLVNVRLPQSRLADLELIAEDRSMSQSQALREAIRSLAASIRRSRASKTSQEGAAV